MSDRDLLAVGALFWVASLARVIYAFVTHEVFGGEATLALGAVILVPALALGARARKQRAGR